MHRAGRLASFTLAVAVLGTMVAFGSAFAKEAHGLSLQLAPSRGSGVSGTATLSKADNGVEVKLQMRGLPEAGVKHINHVHAGGTCADDRAGRTAPVTIPLKPIVARKDGTGSATTIIEDASIAKLFSRDKERFILVHAKTKEGGGVPPGISCADFVRAAANGFSSSEETTMMGETTMMVGTMPASGGSSLLLPVGALLLGAGVLSWAVLRRM